MFRDIFALTVILLLLFSATTASKFLLGSKTKGYNTPKLPASAEDTVNKLQEMMSGDHEWAGGFSRYVKTSQEMSGVLPDYCLIKGFVCNDQFEITDMFFESIAGTVDFSKIPSTVDTITFVKGHLDQPPDMSLVPESVAKMIFEKVEFGEGKLVFNPDSALTSFTCRRCDLEMVKWTTIPRTMKKLDLSRNSNLASVRFATLPASLVELNVSGCGLRSAVEEIKLPDTLRSLDVSNNELSGSLSWKLGEGVEQVFAHHNRIEGTLEPSAFPASLEKVDLSFNQLTGTLDIIHEIKSIRSWRLDGNQFSEVPWKSIPESLEELSVAKNDLTGSIPFETLPDGLRYLSVAYNKLSGSVPFPTLPSKMEYLDISHNMFLGKADLTQFSPAMRFVFLQNNQFTGKADLTQLPLDLRRIIIANNNWDFPLPAP